MPMHQRLSRTSFPGRRVPTALAIVVCLTGCLSTIDSAGAQESAGVQFFERHVRPILVEHCYECHSPGDIHGGLLLDSRGGWMKGGDSGPAIVPGKPDKSLLIEAVRYKNRDLQMPPRNALRPDQVASLEKWVAMGAPDPRMESEATGTSPTGMSIEQGREFWSLKPIGKPAVPEPSNARWVKTPIDAFVLARLEEQGLQPAPAADKRTLIRRVTFDLVGLPPTPDEVSDFLEDESPNAFRNVVERLLASPQYGVRWGRHWLDVARYADSNGLDENLAFGHAWRYRDYVVDTFNSDKPFNRFVMEQLAGDLLPDANRETKTATSFLVLGAKVLAEPDMEKLVMDTIDEQIDTTGKTFMGMTLGCVRCHDHKFDPIKQSDYYALAAIFKSTRTFATTKTGAIKHWYEHSFAEKDELEALKKVDAQIAAKKKAATTFKNSAMTKIRQAARSNATEYLVAATQFDSTTPLKEVQAIAQPRGLHVRILHHCRRHLEYNSDDPFFRAWHELAGRGETAVEAHYRPLFDNIAPALAMEKKKNAKAVSISDPAIEAARRALHDASGFLAVPPKPEFAFDAETLAEYYRLEDEARVLESQSPDEPGAMGVGEDAILTSLPIHVRGSHLNLGDPVPRRFPRVFSSELHPTLPEKQSGRLEFAQWLTNGKHPLTARVYVNRVWGWHFGRAIVESTENFGALGSRPTHPELLDWLARNFMTSGWSTKELHRLILSSNTYQMASQQAQSTRAAEVDPENLLLWKFRMERLEAEQIRDAVLAVSGRLDPKLGGKTVPLRNRQFVFNHTSVDHTKYDSLRRALYLPVIRNNLYTLFQQFDYPDPTMPTGHRNATVVAPQALLMMNAPLITDSADALAKQLLEETPSDSERVARAYELAFGRFPTEPEIRRALRFVNGATDTETWSMLCQGLFASNEFMYVR